MNIGLIGCGKWGRHILRDLRQLGAAVHVVAINENNRSHALQNGAVGVHNSIETLPPVDGYVIATPSDTHGDVLRKLIAAQKPVFCEKPLTIDALSAREAGTALAGKLFVMDKWRYHNGVLALAEVARSGELGPVQGIKTRRMGWGHPHPDCNALWILLPHEIAIAYEVLGKALQPSWAAAECDKTGFAYAATVLFGGTDLWHMSEISVRAHARDRSVLLSCRDGTAFMPDSMADHILMTRNPADPHETRGEAVTEKRMIAVNMPLYDELKDFLQFVKGGTQPKSGARRGIETVEAIEAAHKLAGIAA